jgi:neutral amino acid transport system ATP-binding protein
LSSADREPLLQVRGLQKSFDAVRVLDVDALDVPREGITALIGPNGAGKTTLFDVITGFARCSSGSVHFDGRAITGAAPHTIARGGLVRTFQLTRVLDRLSVRDNVVVAAPDQRGERLIQVLFAPRAVRTEQRRLRERAEELLELVGLAQLADAPAATLSGGQKKLLELARALMLAPRLLMLDEPLAGVNPTLGRQLMDAVERLREHGTAVVLIEHDVETVMRVSDHVLVLASGRLIAAGAPAEVRTDPLVLDAYLGVVEEQAA